ncbi:MAG: lamin tail domain-containing protein, partial [Bacteroidales bacterium]|nr:lamin tail domain-containing protein [Bacteroidales bacterium]
MTACCVLFMAQGRTVTRAVPGYCQVLSPAMPGDVVITEIMADPVSSPGLPGEEYLEILNRSRNSLDLTNWRLSSATQHSLFPGIKIEPGEYLILCAIADTGLFSVY